MPSIINGLFAGRFGISSHGTAIAVVGDNISNASTLGFKASRAEFEDLIAGGQTAGKTVGSGSSIAAVTQIFEQGSLEFTSRPLDLAIDGNGFFVVEDQGSRFYTRAGNFKVDNEGYMVNQNGLRVMGFPAGGSGALEELNVNTISQDSVDTTEVVVSGNVDATSTAITGGTTTSIPGTDADIVGGAGSGVTYSDLNAAAAFSTVVEVFDTLGAQHTLTFFFYKVSSGNWTARGYVNSEDINASATAGRPREIVVSGGTTENSGNINMTFNASGTRTNPPAPGAADMTASITWANGASSSIDISLDPFTQYAANSNILSIVQDGKGVGSVESISIEKNGNIFALLDNGQSASIGTIGLVSFANPEGLTRVGNQLLQQSTDSGEPVIGTPQSGTFGSIQSGAVELSTVDIADQFVKLITLQRGFQANSRIITTINQLLNEIIQLA